MVVTVTSVGDLMINRNDPESIFSHVKNILESSDITFGQLETAYSDKGSKGSSGPRGAMPHQVENYEAIPKAGFDVISLASNHTMDWGEDAILDCMRRLREDDIAPIGAGVDLKDSRKPAYFDRSDLRIAFLAYCSVAPKNYYAGSGRAGVAPMRAITHYEPIEDDQPGTPSETMTFPNESDLDRLVADVEAANKEADIVLVSLHWGVHFIRASIADYQPVVAQAAIDAGAHGIIGHHPHLIKGVEFYRGRPIIYSLGNFAFDDIKTGSGPPYSGDQEIEDEWDRRRRRIYRELYDVPPPEPGSLFQPDARYSIISRMEIGERGAESLYLRPVWIDDDGTPIPKSSNSPEGKEVIEYLENVTKEANLDCTYRIDDDEIEVIE